MLKIMHVSRTDALAEMVLAIPHSFECTRRGFILPSEVWTEHQDRFQIYIWHLDRG
jgi:hypothetical protein